MMNNYPFGSSSPKSFNAYSKGDFDIESGTVKRTKRARNSWFYPVRMIKSLADTLHYYYMSHPFLVFFVSLAFGVTILIVLSLNEHHYWMLKNYGKLDDGFGNYYPYVKLKNLVVVATHSVYTSTSCGEVDKEDSWFLESYQKNPGQAATFLSHIKGGVENAAQDDAALLFEAQNYWTVAESEGWFGKEESVKWRALTEEHARDKRFANLHRTAIGFPESRFFYTGTPAPSTSKEAALKGEALVRAQFQQDPFGCMGSLKKKVGRDPFHRSIPYPSGCPEIEGLFRYCGIVPFEGSLPWA
ncbi:transmembrane emp24 domain-containing protein p24delta4-like [Hibiscus syriacus]|uniref:Transmembrane emp24 domain-containing protein p24delta4-like n=1 Tax=Hibiscus syriacus TaxID=106335 RepID=A0A6A3CZQ4_HIBSY|nr:transmembrane emp24 domain-containing protein p24delta4-like [Hibiscus syriacus]